MQRLELARADSEPVDFREGITLPGDAFDDRALAVENVLISGVVERSENGYLLEGDLNAEAQLRCARCLKEFSFGIKEHLSLRLLPAAQAPRDEELQLDRSDLDVVFYDEPFVDLGEVAAEQVELAVPAKPLCHESCKGLCPRCGADMNQGLCGCPRTTDPRWMPLAGWPRRG